MGTVLHTIDLTTNASGAASDTVNVGEGVLMQLRYVPDGTSPLDTGSDLAITDEQGFAVYTHANIGTTAFSRLPRHLIADAADGSVSTTLYDYIALKSPLTVAITNGGNTLSGTFYLWVRD